MGAPNGLTGLRERVKTLEEVGRRRESYDRALARADQLLAQALASGERATDLADSLGVSRWTVYRRRDRDRARGGIDNRESLWPPDREDVSAAYRRADLANQRRKAVAVEALALCRLDEVVAAAQVSRSTVLTWRPANE